MTGENGNAGWSPVTQGTTEVRTNCAGDLYPPGKTDTFFDEHGMATTTTIHTASISTQGPLLYELIEDKMECHDKLCCRTGTFKAQFFENEVVLRSSRKWCVFPKQYRVVVIPRFKLIDVTVDKGISLPCWAKFLALCFLAGGITLLIVGAVEYCEWVYSSSSSSSNSFSRSSSGHYACEKNGAAIAFGVIFIVISLSFYIYACCRSKYITVLYVKRSVGTRSLFSFLTTHTVAYHVSSDEVPNEEFLIQYVYYPMREASKSAHVLTHLNMAALCHPLEPRYFPDSAAAASAGGAHFRGSVPPGGRRGSPPPRHRPAPSVRTTAAA